MDDIDNISEQLKRVILDLEGSKKVMRIVLSEHFNFDKADNFSEKQEERTNAYILCHNYDSCKALLKMNLKFIGESIEHLKSIDSQIACQII